MPMRNDDVIQTFSDISNNQTHFGYGSITKIHEGIKSFIFKNRININKLINKFLATTINAH
jgi:hypothetical protein